MRIVEPEENPPSEVVLPPPSPDRAPVTPGRGWKLPDGNYLLAAGATRPWPISWMSRVTLPDGTELDGWTCYWVCTPSGKTVATYPGPKDYCLDDYAYMYDLHAVTDRKLCVFLWSEQAFHEAVTSMKNVVLDGLMEVSLSDLPFDPADVS